MCGSGSLRARPNQDLLYPEYLVRIMLNTFASKWLALASVGTTMDNLNTEIIGNLSIPVPSMREQQEICAQLIREMSSMESLMNITLQTLNLLQERRTSLISAAVTGQICITA